MGDSAAGFVPWLAQSTVHALHLHQQKISAQSQVAHNDFYVLWYCPSKNSFFAV